MTTQYFPLAELRHAANLSVKDLAYLLGIKPGSLRQIEHGQKQLTLPELIGYHILFNAPLEDIITEEYASIYALLVERSESLIAKLKSQQSSKSVCRITAVTKFVNLLNNDKYDGVN